MPNIPAIEHVNPAVRNPPRYPIFPADLPFIIPTVPKINTNRRRRSTTVINILNITLMNGNAGSGINIILAIPNINEAMALLLPSLYLWGSQFISSRLFFEFFLIKP